MYVEKGEDERRRRKSEQSATWQMSFQRSITMPEEGDEQRSRVPNLAAALRDLKFLDIRHE